MYNFGKCVIGLAPTRRDQFKESCKEEIVKKIKALADRYNIDLVTIDGITREGILVYNDEIDKIVRHFNDHQVDAIFVPHANFGQEEAVAKLCAKMAKPVLLWGPRDASPTGNTEEFFDRPTYDIQCGLFATGKALLSYGVPFTYIENCAIDSPVLEQGFESFARTVCAARAMKGARVAQLSVRPWQFLSVKYNESELLEKFGIEVVPIETTELQNEIKRVQEFHQGDIRDQIALWHKHVDLSLTPADVQEKLAAVAIGVKNLADVNGCRVAAGECWKMLQNLYGINACFVWGALTAEGLPVACETDVLGAIGTGMMLGATRGQVTPFFADITIRHPSNDNGELLWHCGPFPYTLAKRGATLPSVLECRGQWEIEGGDVTLLRIGSQNGRYTLFADQAVGTEGPRTNGTYLWIETDNWPKWERKFVKGPYIHHVTGAHGKYQTVLHEALQYIGDIHPDRVD